MPYYSSLANQYYYWINNSKARLPCNVNIIVFQEDWTPVMLATKNGHTDVVKFLVDHGADIHRQKAVSCFLLLLKVIKRLSLRKESISVNGLTWLCELALRIRHY